MKALMVGFSICVCASAWAAGPLGRNPVLATPDEAPSRDHREPASGGCESCHAGQNLRVRVSAVLKFSHALHCGQGLACSDCHRSGLAVPVADFASCRDCHQGWLATGRCDACHPANAAGRLRLKLSGGELIPRGGHGGDDHGLAWGSAHGAAAKGRERSCRVCHARNRCDRCHRGVNKPMRHHPGDWESLHATLARGDAHRCQVCHRSQSECLRCHRRAGVVEGTAGRSNRRIHAPGFADPGRHGPEARRNLVGCTACHGEADCIRCHGGQGIGSGVSPHRPGFRSRCRLMRDRNPRPCAKCHGAEELSRLCP
jgi:hypothetical protein